MRSASPLLFLLPCLLAVDAPAQPKKEPGLLQNGVGVELDRTIPANERGIVCLAAGTDGRVYAGTTGRAAHLFAYDPKEDKAADLVRLDGGIGLSYALIPLAGGALIAGTQADPTGTAVRTDGEAVGWLYKFAPGKDGQWHAEKLGRPVEGQGIYTLAFDPLSGTVFGNTWPDGHFFTYDLKTRKFADHGAIAGYKPFEGPREAEDLSKGTGKKVTFPRVVSRAILVVPGTGAFTGGEDGWLYWYDAGAAKIEKTGTRLPAVPGREEWAALDRITPPYREQGRTPGPRLGAEAGVGATADGYLFEFRTGPGLALAITAHGRPVSAGPVQGLVGRRDRPLPGMIDVTGVQGGTGLMPRSFQSVQGTGLLPAAKEGLTTHSGTVTPGPIPAVDGQPSMVGFGAMVRVGGDIYAGEIDRVGRLVRYPLDEEKAKTPRPRREPPKLLGEPADEVICKLKCRVVFAPEGTTTDGSGYTALEVGLDGNVYCGATRYGGYAWLLRFDPESNTMIMERVVNVQDLTGERLQGICTQGKIHAIIIVGPDGRIWFATKQAHEIFGTRPEYGVGEESYPGGHLCYYDPKTGFSRSVGILKKHEGLMGGVMDPVRGQLYYRSEPRNHFLAYDLKTGDVRDCGHVGNNCRYMAIGRDGGVYTTGRGDYLCRYDPETGYVEDLHVKVEGEGEYSAPYVIRMGPNGKLYGAGTHHPWIMEFDVANCKKGPFPEVTVRNVAPAAPPGLPVQDIHAGVFGKDGKFYYTLVTTGPVDEGGKAEKHLRIMRFDPQAGRTETVGIPDYSGLDESKVKHLYVRGDRYNMEYIQGMAVGRDGSLYVMDIYPQLNVVCFPQLTAPAK